MRPGWVYMMASRRNGTLYVGVTSNLQQRIWQHREEAADGFTKDHGCKTLVWVEAHDDIHAARQREVCMKKWKCAWKVELIEAGNRRWLDLWPNINN